MTFGNPCGLALDEKQQREVTGGAVQGSPSNNAAREGVGRTHPRNDTRAIHRPVATAAPAVPATSVEDPGLQPLDAETIRQVLATVRGLSRPALEGFTKAFRKRFHPPDEAPSRADRICQRRHHNWIKAFLVQHQRLVA